MTAGLARAMMRVAASCLGESRSEWAAAMHGEFRSAIDDGRPLAFATGCLVAAWREMPLQEQGRFVLANYALALGMLIPMAVLQFECVVGVPYLSFGQHGLLYTLLTPGNEKGLYLAEAYRAAIPPLVALWTLLGLGHLRMAWALLERDWARVLKFGAMTVAASATLVIFTIVLFLDDAGAALQAALLAMELVAIYALARWHARAFPTGSSGNLVWLSSFATSADSLDS